MNPSTALSTVLVDELVRGGVRHVVLSPGSRSAPLAYALHDADAAGRLVLHVRIDERSAAFVALGLAKASGPVAVVTTSGTAVANLHPAVLEASQGGVPLVLLTADRPPELRGTGANQTADQVGIFGAAVRWSHDLGVPDDRVGQVAAWRSTVCRALASATGSRRAAAGPVHLNLPLREPLVPDADPSFVEPLDGRAGGAPWVTVPGHRDDASGGGADIGGVDGGGIGSGRGDRADGVGARTLVLVGDLPASGPDWGAHAADLAQAHGWPMVAEPTSRGARRRAVPYGSLLLTCADWVNGHRPDRVLVVGRVTLARSAAALLRHPQTRVELVTDDPVWPDPQHRVSAVHPLPVLQSMSAPGRPDVAWCDTWHAAGAKVAASIEHPLRTSWPSGPAVAAAVTRSVPGGSTLFAGSSTAVRDLDLVGGSGPAFVANRGVAGIDGCVSTAAGLALGGSAPTYALVGDLTFVHDANALVVGPAEPQPDLTIVVVNDDGGGIFTLLEPGAAQLAGPFERIFGTPHGTDLERLCAATETRYIRADTRADLEAAVARRPVGRTVVEVRLDRGSHRAVHQQLRAAAASALSV